jgi:hypothetical protein
LIIIRIEIIDQIRKLEGKLLFNQSFPAAPSFPGWMVGKDYLICSFMTSLLTSIPVTAELRYTQQRIRIGIISPADSNP